MEKKPKLILCLLLLCIGINTSAQTKHVQDIGINMAGLLIKNQATVAPALFYKYTFGKYQLRVQLALDGKLDSKDRKGNFNNAGSFGSFNQDTVLHYNPGRNVKYGLMVGMQRNHEIDKTNFSYFYGLDLMFMMADMYQSAEGFVLQSNGGFDTTKQRVSLKIRNENKLNTFGIGLPIGITYKFGQKFYTSIEAKFIIAYQIGKSNLTTETSQIQNFDIFTSKSESGTDFEGFDFGIKPLTGLSIGMFF